MFDGCNLQDCHWVFDESARRTLEWLIHVCHSFGPNGEQAYQQIIDDIGKRAVRPQDPSVAGAGEASSKDPESTVPKNAGNEAVGGEQIDAHDGRLSNELA